MDKRYNDTDLREALHRKYADTRGHATAASRLHGEDGAADGRTAGCAQRFSRWGQTRPPVALGGRCRLYLINNRYRLARPVFRLDTSSCSIEYAQSVNRARSINQSSTLSCSIEHAQSVNRARSINQSSTLSCSIGAPQPTNRGAPTHQSRRPNPPIEAPQSSNRGAPTHQSGRPS